MEKLNPMEEAKSCTVRFIAEQLGIHYSTVSRVLSGNDQVARKAASRETVEKIRSFAAQNGYSPNPLAITFRTQQSRLIGVSVPRLSDIIWATIYEGIENAALNRGYFAYVTNSYDKPEIQKRQMDLAMARRVEGLILGDMHTTQESLDFLAGVNVPFVLALRRAGTHLSVTCDDRDGGRQAAKFLFSQGHRDVAVLGGLLFASTGQDRTQGFTDFYREAGHSIPEDRVIHASFDTQSGHESARRLLELHPSLTAIYAVNDFAAIGAMGAARMAGLTPGESIALIGYNDTPLAAELPIPLATIRNPVRQLGEEAMKLLFQRLAGAPCDSVVLKPQLIVRESGYFSARSLA